MIRAQYGDETLSLASISEALHISPNYLSALIRKNTGETFVNLLTAQRLDAGEGASAMHLAQGHGNRRALRLCGPALFQLLLQKAVRHLAARPAAAERGGWRMKQQPLSLSSLMVLLVSGVAAITVLISTLVYTTL